MVWMGPESEISGAPPVVTEGLFAMTPVATTRGWVAVGALQPGDLLLTFDDGPQPVVASYSAYLEDGNADQWPLRVPAGALENREEISLLPDQKVLIESDAAERLFGDPFALVPARALHDWRGIERFHPMEGERVVQLRFRKPQVIYASRGVLLSCAGEEWDAAVWQDPGHTVCTMQQSRHLAACLIAEEAGAALNDGGTDTH